MRRDIGLALSGGGFRAAAFHLGCLRALNDRDLLPRVRVVSGVSGGALLAALYAYGPSDFGSFDRTATELLAHGLELAIARRILLSKRTVQSAFSLASLPITGAISVLRQLARGRSSNAGTNTVHGAPAMVRHVNRTTAFADVLAGKLFGGRKMPEVTHSGLDVVLNACDLVSGGAVRFGSRTSSCSRFGEILDEVQVASAVAASAAFPVLLPALEQRYRFRNRAGNLVQHVVMLTDGGVYDNLGLSVFGMGRDERYTPHVYDVDYVIACDAGQGSLAPAAPHIWPTRMHRVVEIMHGRAQYGERGLLYAAQATGKLAGFVHAYLGMRDDKLAMPISDLVPREAVIAYPTNFRAMSSRDLDALATRGEQLVRALLTEYCPALV